MVPIQRDSEAGFHVNDDEASTTGRAPPHLAAWAPERWAVAQDWDPVINPFLTSEAGQQLGRFIREQLNCGAAIYPPQPFRALALTPLGQVKVVILGQDPYHGPGQAQGLAFSVPQGVRSPPSLRNIFREIARDPELTERATPAPEDGSLVRWARQGVLLLNTCLTVEEGQAASHAGRGWEVLTDALVTTIATRREPVVFLLWGVHAQAKQNLIVARGAETAGVNAHQHLVLTANHPSPLSALRTPAPFSGCGHFSRANAFLKAHGCAPIAW